MALMRTAVIRINIDPAGELSGPELGARMELLVTRANSAGIAVADSRVGTMPAHRREIQLHMTGADGAMLRRDAEQLCAEIFGTAPTAGAVTYISRGTDDDANGILSGFGITGDVSRITGDEGFDIITVRLASSDLARVPESRIQTALEAATNCEIRIVTT